MVHSSQVFTIWKSILCLKLILNFMLLFVLQLTTCIFSKKVTFFVWTTAYEEEYTAG